jgi:hypothetical protein
VKKSALALLFVGWVGTAAFAQTTTTGPTKPATAEPVTSGAAPKLPQDLPPPSPAEQVRCKERPQQQLNEPARSACDRPDK